MKSLLKFPELRKKFLITLLFIVLFRALSHVPIPSINTEAVKQFLGENVFFGLLNLFSGGGFKNFSIVTLGLIPYINVSIFIQLLVTFIPSLEELQKEGEQGREKINMYTKLITVPVALLQSYGLYFSLSRMGIIQSLGTLDLVIFLLTLTAGSMSVIWFADLLTEYGIGNGTSVIVFIGIVGSIPSFLFSLFVNFNTLNLFLFAAYMLFALLVVLAVVYVNEGTRNLEIEYGRRSQRSTKVANFLPIKINQTGVVPIIFAVSMVSLPALIAAPLSASANPTLQGIGLFLSTHFNLNSAVYNILYFALVFGFTFLYTFIQFSPNKIAEDIKKSGGFIPGIRPGMATEKYLKGIISRLTFYGAFFLAFVAIMPYLIQVVFGFESFAVGGTSLLIVVSVILEIVRQVHSLIRSTSYDRFIS